MKTCETCKHWKLERRDWEYDSLRFGECAAILMRETMQEAALTAAGVERYTDEAEAVTEKAMREAKAFCVDGSSYYAALRTAPDFGCVLHEPKE